MDAVSIVQFALLATERIEFLLQSIGEIRADADGVVCLKCVDHLLRKFEIVEFDLNRLTDVCGNGAGEKVVIHCWHSKDGWS